MPTYRFSHTRLLVQDFAACFRFYRDVLGFTPTWGSETDVYASFDTGDVILALYGRQMMADALGAAIGSGDQPDSPAGAQDRVLLQISVDDVDATYESLRDKGVTFIAPPTDRPTWGIRTAHFRDPDGTLIEITHAIPMAEE